MAAAAPADIEALPGSRRRQRYSLKGADILLFALLGVALFFIAYPIFVILYRAIASAASDSALVQQSLRDPSLFWVLFNTVAVVAASGALALLLGSLCAWLNERTDAGGTAMERFLPIVPLMIPTIAAVIGWVTLLSARAGLLNTTIRSGLSSLGIEMKTGPFDIFSWPGYVFVMFLYLFPFVYILVSRAFQSLDPALEEAAAINGAGMLRSFRRVTLPAIKPALSAAILIIIIQGVANFSIAIIIGTGAGIDVLSARIYRLLYNYPPNVEQAVYMSLFMTAVVQIALLLQRSVIRKERFSVIGGKASQQTRIRLGRWRRPARMLVGLYIALTTVIPLSGLVLVSLQPFWSTNIAWERLSFDNYATAVFERGITGQAILNSLMLGSFGGIIGIALTGWVLLTVQRRPRWIAFAADFVLSMPAALPHSIVGVGFVLAFSQGWLNLRGTYAILLIAYLVMFLPQAAGAAAAATTSVGRDLVEAARLNRAGALRALWRVQLPLMLPTLFSGWVILFVHMSGELTASALIAGVDTPVIGLVLLDQWENGSFPQVAAIAVVITIVSSAMVLCSMWLVHRRSVSR